jgi:glycosyltransferase involved in cell wall biosynthesis
MQNLGPQDVSAVVCTMNSISGIERCLQSLRAAGVTELIVVDANSFDGTKEIAEQFADKVLTDPGQGLGMARNIGIEQTTKPLILNMGSDNVMPSGELEKMITALTKQTNVKDANLQGVSAQTFIEGDDYVSNGLNAWRKGRFLPGPAAVIGTPTLFNGNTLRAHPYDPTRRFSDDSELCERWAKEFGATFAISDAVVHEVGKTSWSEVVIRCKMYGISDAEVFKAGKKSGWGFKRRTKSYLHPARVDLVEPLMNLDASDKVKSLPFLVAFTAMRYDSWIKTSWKNRWHAKSDS